MLFTLEHKNISEIWRNLWIPFALTNVRPRAASRGRHHLQLALELAAALASSRPAPMLDRIVLHVPQPFLA